ncbi:MAG: hypothetical protein ACXVZO_03540 [Gaiellaceae bacterium]
MKLRRHALWLVVAIAASTSFASAAPVSSGLHGTVRRGPITPVCRVGVPCDRPAGHLTLVFSRRGRERGRVTTRADGSYRIQLAPGLYQVRATRGFLRTPRPPTAEVRRGRLARVDFFFDTGIR